MIHWQIVSVSLYFLGALATYMLIELMLESDVVDDSDKHILENAGHILVIIAAIIWPFFILMSSIHYLMKDSRKEDE